jgi:hypothetical protein
VVEARGGTCFAQESKPSLVVTREKLGEKPERDTPAKEGVLGLPSRRLVVLA